MKIIINKILPPSGFLCINFFGILFCRRQLNDIDINHEAIHTAQMKEMLYIFFYIWYILEWFIKLFKYRDGHEAYKNISLEIEAYSNESNLLYLNNRKHYNWCERIFN